MNQLQQNLEGDLESKLLCVDVVNSKDELPSFSDNHIESVNECILPMIVDSGITALTLPVLADVNCEGESIQHRRRGRRSKRPPPSIDVSNVKDQSPSNCNNCEEESIQCRCRGMPRKQLPPSVDASNVKGESPSCSNTQIQCVNESILPFSVHSGNAALALSVPADINCKKESILHRRRGRLRKRPPLSVSDVKDESPPHSNSQMKSVNESILPLCVHSVNAALAFSVPSDVNCEEESIQPKSRGRARKRPPPTVAVLDIEDESPSHSSNPFQSVSEPVLPLRVDSGNITLALSSPADVNCEEELIQHRCRGRPRKRSLLSTDVSDAKDPSPSRRNNQIQSVSELGLHSSVNSGNISVALSVPSDVNCKVESLQHRSGGRPRKNLFPSVNDCVAPSRVELRKGTSTLLSSSKSEVLNQHVSSGGCQTGKFSMGMCEEIDIGNLAAKFGSNSCTENKRITGKPVAVTSNNITDQTPLTVNAIELSVAVAPETCQNTISGRCKTDSCQLATKSGQTARIPERMMEEKETTVACEDGSYPILSTSNEDRELAQVVPTDDHKCQDPMILGSEVAYEKSAKADLTSSLIPKDITFPRVVLCLEHNGKVAWDVKWKPQGVNNSEGKHHMGYLAVLLGNGSLEVWEVPLPGMVRVLYTSGCSEGTDPRFLKLKPVFRCSKVTCGNQQSIPMTMEWSPSSSHDLILAGCHDGTVALWQFSTQYSLQDTKPLLYFNADSVPIRAVAWAPEESDAEGANLFVTAGHEGLKFWDLRNPYRPLWVLNPVQRAILSLDWLRNPWCIILSFDDGTLRILSLHQAANDVPVTGKPFAGTKFQGLHSYPFSSFAIWSIQASRTTGLVAYCCVDGSAVRFQLTAKSVDKDPRRNHMPRYLCGSLIEGGQALKINTPLLNTTFEPKKCLVECGETTRTILGYLSDTDQAKQENSPVNDDRPLVHCGETTKTYPVHLSEAHIVRTTALEPTNVEKKETDSSQMAHQAFMSCDGDKEVSHRNGDGSALGFEVFPSKVLALHRVRWNMNKGSERWLCYGGAAGVVRCQQIPFAAMH